MSADRVAAAVALAAEEHAGQVDKGGSPYILHAVHVMAHVRADDVDNPYERDALLCAAVMHDVIEDTRSNRKLLEQRIYDEFGHRCSQALDALTRRRGDDYMLDYIERIKRDWIARRVKIADLRHNLDASRLPDGADDPDREHKYLRALSALLGEEQRSPGSSDQRQP